MSFSKLSHLAICFTVMVMLGGGLCWFQDPSVTVIAAESIGTDENKDGASDSQQASNGLDDAKAATNSKNNSKDNKKSKQEALEEVTGDSPARPLYWATRSMEMRFGLNFNAGDNQCTGLHATLPFPMSWPEQEVELVGFDMPQFARYKLRPQKQGVGEIVIDLDRMSPNDSFDVVGTVMIKKSFIKPPEDVSILKLPNSPQRNKALATYLGDSPYIETKTRQIRTIANEIRDRGHENAWKHIEAIYDYVRENIEYKSGEIRSSTEALKDGTGDCEEMTSVFIAICRASQIPARCVWVPDHCYPEFYLEVDKDNGYWFPCQVAGDRQFGEMNEYRPILQKGDRFKTPESKKEVRYLAETFTCKLRATGTTSPFIRQIQDLGPLSEELKGLKDGASQKAEAQTTEPVLNDASTTQEQPVEATTENADATAESADGTGEIEQPSEK